MLLKKIEEILTLLESGDFVDVQSYLKDVYYDGEYEDIVLRLGNLSRMLSYLRDDSGYMNKNMLAGSLDLKINTEKYFGSFHTIVTGINDTVVQIAAILKYFGQTINQFQLGKYQRIDDDFSGDFNVYKNAINFLADELEKNHQKKLLDNWKTDAIAKLNTILSGELTAGETSQIALEFICNYLNADVGSVYIASLLGAQFNLSASYGIQHENLPQVFASGNGTIGVVGKSRVDKLTLNPEDSDLKIISSYGIQIPKCIYTFPLVFQGQLAGVVELGFTKVLDDNVVLFIKELNLILSAFILAAVRSDKINVLLKESLLANERLEIQSEELQQTNTQLEEANLQMEEQQQQLEETNAQLEEQQQQIEEFSKSLQEQNKNLELSDKYKSEFLANMSHELRTPLNSVILLTEVLLENKHSTLIHDDIKKISIVNAAGNELLRLINDILDLSKIESGNMDVVISTISTTSIMNDIKSQFEFASAKKYVQFECIDNANLNLIVDKDKLIQIIRNLLSNAFKFTLTGHIRFYIKKSSINNFVDFIVEDSGIGIDDDKLNIIFDAFKQADGTTSRQFGGTGLGLSISKELSNILLGHINVTSIKGHGSTFSLTIPINYNNMLAESSRQSCDVQQRVTQKQHDIDDFHNLVITDRPFLVISDDEDCCRILIDHIHSKHDKVVWSKNGSNAMSVLNSTIVFKGILLDLDLPDIDGIEVLKEIKSNIKFTDLPLYVISEKDRDEFKKDSSSEGNKRIDIILDDISKKNKLIGISKNKNKIDFMGKKILIVDDDERNIYILNEALASRNANVISASNGVDAIRKVNEEDGIDLILMDIMMPIMDGYEAIAKLKASNHSKIPIIALTAKAMDADRKKCIEVGANDYISKPLNMEIFLKLVRAWL